jgi:catechol 2,3-dioxygenase-like lactoylglutathione lyase family enzyme
MRQAGDVMTDRGPDGITVGHRIVRLSHVVVNVSDLERSRAFYEATTPLRAVSRLSAPAQRFAGLGIDHGEFVGYVLDDGTAGRPGQVHLVEWKTPRPVGSPYQVFWHVGIGKLGFGTKMPAEERLARLAELGVRPTNEEIVRGYISITDPDGTVLSFYQDPVPSARYDHWVHVNAVATDGDRSTTFYRDVLGLEHHLDVFTDRPLPASQGPGADMAQWSSHLFAARGDNRLNIDMTQPIYPPPSPETSTVYEEAHHLGISRIGFEVDDVDAVSDLLRAVEPIGQAPGVAGPPEVWDFGPEYGERKVLSLRDPDGIRIEFVEKPPRPESSYLRFTPPEE